MMISMAMKCSQPPSNRRSKCPATRPIGKLGVRGTQGAQARTGPRPRERQEAHGCSTSRSPAEPQEASATQSLAGTARSGFMRRWPLRAFSVGLRRGRARDAAPEGCATTVESAHLSSRASLPIPQVDMPYLCLPCDAMPLLDPATQAPPAPRLPISLGFPSPPCITPMHHPQASHHPHAGASELKHSCCKAQAAERSGQRANSGRGRRCRAPFRLLGHPRRRSWPSWNGCCRAGRLRRTAWRRRGRPSSHTPRCGFGWPCAGNTA